MRLCVLTLIVGLAGYGQPTGCKTCQTGQGAQCENCNSATWPLYCCAPPHDDATYNCQVQGIGCLRCASCCSTYSVSGPNGPVVITTRQTTKCDSTQSGPCDRTRFQNEPRVVPAVYGAHSARVARIAYTRGADIAPNRVPASVSRTYRDVDVVDAWIELSDGRVVNEGFSLVNRANSPITAYEVQWVITERSGTRRVFTAQVDSLAGSPIAGSRSMLKVENGMCTGPFPLFFAKADATLTYYELADGTIYDSGITGYAAGRRTKKAEQRSFVRSLVSGVAGVSAAEGRRTLEDALRSSSVQSASLAVRIAAAELAAMLQVSGFEPTLAAMKEIARRN